MATMTLDLNDELIARLGDGNLAADVVRIVALQLFRDGKVSLVKAAECAQTPIEEFKAFARAHGERPPDLVDSDESSRERRAIEYLDSLELPTPPWLEHAWQVARANGTDQLLPADINQEIADARRDRREPSAQT